MQAREHCTKHAGQPEEELRQVLEAAPAVKPYVEGRRVRCLVCLAHWLMASVRHLEIGK